MPIRITALAIAFVLTLLWAACVTGRPSTGFLIDIAIAPEECGDGRPIVATLARDGRVQLNMETIAVAEVGRRLRDVLRTRADKLIFVKAESDVSFGDFVQMLDLLHPEAEVLSLITPQVELLARTRFCIAPSCGECTRLRSPGNR
jgi:biopolymer transport protein ExbD